jgi:excisionase family DNA binding protein
MTTTKEIDYLLSVPQVAARWNIGERTVWRMIASGEIPVVKLSKRLTRIRESAADQHIQKLSAGEPAA